ncbi:hypothetical protein RN04_03570 [Arthrobacter sp. W1]|nr:hypothetical protein RN04_03570 [Arthrobacter sp. W1]
MELPFESGSWSRKRNGRAGGQLTINTLDERFQGVQRLPIWPWQSWVVIEWQHPSSATWHVVYAGVITEDSYDWASKKITISHQDVWSIFDQRIVTTDRTNDIAGSKVIWSGLSKATMIKRIIQNSISSFGSPLMYDMPFLLPADEAGTEELTVYGYNFEKASDLINDYIEDDGGPDIDFRPYWTSYGSLAWALEVNANKALVWDYDLDADQASVENLTYKLSGSALCIKVYGAGEGSERRTLVRQSDHNESNYLAMEDSEKFSGVKDLAKLQSITTGNRLGRAAAIRQIDMTVRADGSPALNELALGGSVRWKADNDVWLPSGWHSWEVIAFSGSLTDETIKITTQDLLGPEADA